MTPNPLVTQPHWACPPITAEESHWLTGATPGTCVVCIARPGSCHCPACGPRVCGADVETIALDLGRSRREIKELLVRHGTDIDRRGHVSHLARAAAPLVLALLLPLVAQARGLPVGGAGPLPPRPPTAEIEARTSASVVPMELLTTTIVLDGVAFFPPESEREEILLPTLFRGEDGHAYRWHLRRVTQDGGLVWLAVFERVGRSWHERRERGRR